MQELTPAHRARTAPSSTRPYPSLLIFGVGGLAARPRLRTVIHRGRASTWSFCCSFRARGSLRSDWLISWADGADKVISRDDGGLSWEDLVDEHVMEIGVQIGAAVLHHDESIVPVSSFEYGR